MIFLPCLSEKRVNDQRNVDHIHVPNETMVMYLLRSAEKPNKTDERLS